MNPFSRRGWDWSSIRGLNARRASPRPGTSAIERLESRFLLAGSGIDLVGPDAEIPIEGLATDSSIASTPAPAGTMSTDPATAAVPAGRVDAYTLDAGSGEPEVQVQLRWNGGADPGDGQLVVLDASGATLFESSLAGVSELRTSVMVPNGQPGPISTSPLAIDLTIQRATDGTTGPGTYRLSLAWRPASAPPPAAPGVAGVVSTPFSFPPASIFTPTPGLPGLDVVGILPAPPAASAPGAAASTPPTGLTITPPTGAAAPPNPASGSTNPGIPAPPATVVGLPPASTPAPSNVGSHASTAPAGVSSAPGTASSSSDRDLSTFVGPLPFGASTPDGGIFERSFATTTSNREGNAIGRPATASPSTPLARAIPTEAEGVGWSTPLFVGRGEIPVGLRPIDLDRLGPSGGELASGGASAGVAFLPPLGRLSAAERRDGSGRDVEASRPMPRGVRGNPVVAALVAMTSSAAMVLTLGGPDRVRAILAARSSKKRRPL